MHYKQEYNKKMIRVQIFMNLFTCKLQNSIDYRDLNEIYAMPK